MLFALTSLLFYGIMITVTRALVELEPPVHEGDKSFMALVWPFTIWFVVGKFVGRKTNEFVKFLNEDISE